MCGITAQTFAEIPRAGRASRAQGAGVVTDRLSVVAGFGDPDPQRTVDAVWRAEQDEIDDGGAGIGQLAGQFECHRSACAAAGDRQSGSAGRSVRIVPAK